jgi:hypothetical protein
MILITSISVQDKLDYHGRRQAYVMELAGPHSPDEFVIEIGEEIYQKLMQVYEANGSSLQGDPVMAELATHPASPPPSATPEEFDSVRRKLIEEESKHSSMVPEEFAGRPLSQDSPGDHNWVMSRTVTMMASFSTRTPTSYESHRPTVHEVPPVPPDL